MLHGISSVTSFNFISVAVVKLVKKCTCLYRKKYVNPRHSPGDTLFQIVILMIHRQTYLIEICFIQLNVWIILDHDVLNSHVPGYTFL